MRSRADRAINPRIGHVAIRVGLTLVGILVGFAALQSPVRRLEAEVAAAIAGFVTRDDLTVVGFDVFVFPSQGGFFRAVLTPSCSSLASILAISTLGWLAPGYSRPRRFAALLVAVMVIIVGNMLRLSGSLAAGVWLGRIGLVAFHDVVGGTLTFVYILGGYLLMLRILLPKEVSISTSDRDPSGTDEAQGSDRGVLV
jgi:exosortase/archaeosortase family protein